MRIEDVYVQGQRTWVRLHEKGGKAHEMPCHYNLDEYVHAYLQTATLEDNRKGYLFRSAKGRSGQFSHQSHEPSQCLTDDWPPRGGCFGRHPDWLPLFLCHRHHRVPAQWRQAGSGPIDSKP